MTRMPTRPARRPEADAEEQLRRLVAVDPLDDDALSQRCTEVSDWRALVKQADRHGVIGLLDRALTASTFRPEPEIRDAFRRRAAVQRLSQRRFAEVLDEILRALAGAGVEVVVLKGPVLGERLYGEASLRVSSDLDLMVAPQALAAAAATLDGLGFRTEAIPEDAAVRGHHVKALRTDSPVVELHHRLSANLGVLIPSEEFLMRSLPHRTAQGADCRVLAVEDELFYLVLHAAEHLFARLAWLVDIKALAAQHPSLDPARAADHALGSGVASVYDFATALICRRMEIATPLAVLPGGRGCSRIRAALARALLSAEARSRHVAARKIQGHLFRALFHPGASSAARHLWRELRRVRGRH
jgi:hypothetical protein